MSGDRSHIVVIGLSRMQQALRATVVQSSEEKQRSVALNYLEITESVLLSATRDADWLNETSSETGQFNEITGDIAAAAQQQVWARVLDACYHAFRALPGEPAWKPKNPIPPP